MNEKDVRLTYRFLGHKKETEIRLIDPTGNNRPRSVFVKDEEEFVEVCRDYDGIYNIYVGINERSHEGTTGATVVSVNAIVLDIDSVHLHGYPATVSETHNALDVAERIYDYLSETGKDVYMAMSGNGWQIWTAVDIEITDDNRANVEYLLQEYQREIMRTFQDNTCKIDNVGDLSRVIKVIGTTALKSLCDVKRPFRCSFWRVPPYGPGRNSDWSKKIESMAKELPRRDYKPPADFSEGDITEEELAQIVNGMSESTRELFDGKWQGKRYLSRSEAEIALVIRLAMMGVSKDKAWAIMERCRIGKWQEAKFQYKELTIRKAFSYVE